MVALDVSVELVLLSLPVPPLGFCSVLADSLLLLDSVVEACDELLFVVTWLLLLYADELVVLVDPYWLVAVVSPTVPG